MPEIETNLGEWRRKRGLSAIQLAATIGVSRQTIYAMEAGTYVPNTAVALRLARALETPVETLFALTDNALPELKSELATMLPGSPALQPGQVVQLCQVDRRLMASPPSPIPWYFPSADAVVSDRPAALGKTQAKTPVRLIHSDGGFDNRILVAGCDPGISVLARHAQAAGVELVLTHRNSSQGLALLKEGCVHIAGTHLRDEATGESNLPQIAHTFQKNSVAVISFADWEEGILTQRGNPKNIRGIEDLTAKNVSIVNREQGAGSRALLDSRLEKLGIDARRVKGYRNLAQGHLPAAWQVQSGAADCCVATRAAARVFGLHFIPLVSERYDLVIRKEHLDLPRVQNLLDILGRSAFRRELESLGGYDTRITGKRQL